MIISLEGWFVLFVVKEVWIGVGGLYIKIDVNCIENGMLGDIFEKCVLWNKFGVVLV